MGGLQGVPVVGIRGISSDGSAADCGGSGCSRGPSLGNLGGKIAGEGWVIHSRLLGRPPLHRS